VLCEKPLTRRPVDAEAAFDAAERAGRVLAEGFMWRHHPQAARLLALVRERTVGELRLIRAAFSFDVFGGGRPDDVRLQAALDGGGLMDVGCYCVSALRLLAGEPVTVSGRRIDGVDGVDVRFTGTLAFAAGVLGSFDCGLDMVARSELEVVGDAGSLFLSDPWHSRAPRIELRRPDAVETIAVEAANPYACELEDFAPPSPARPRALVPPVQARRRGDVGRRRPAREPPALPGARGEAAAVVVRVRVHQRARALAVVEPEHMAELVHRDPDAERRRPTRHGRVEHHRRAPIAGAADRRREAEAAPPAARAQLLRVGDEHDVGALAVGRAHDPDARAGPVPARRGGVDGRAAAGRVEVGHAAVPPGLRSAGGDHRQLVPAHGAEPERERGYEWDGEPRAGAPRPPQKAAGDDHGEMGRCCGDARSARVGCPCPSMHSTLQRRANTRV